MGLERVLLAVADEGLAPPIERPLDAYVVAIGEAARAAARPLVAELRAAGLAADLAYEDRPLKAQLKMADRADARTAVIIGEQELADGAVTVRRMDDGRQTAVPLTSLPGCYRPMGIGMTDGSPLATSMRSHACGSFAPTTPGATSRCAGGLRTVATTGVTFIDLRDREVSSRSSSIPRRPPRRTPPHRTCAGVGGSGDGHGPSEARRDGQPALATGEVEVVASALEVLARADTPPFVIEDRAEADELLRLEYRYLDLRRPEMTANLRLRHRVTQLMREHLDALGFVEVETPMLGRATPEGYRDFLVPARVRPGTFFALPRSPQQLKQLLMVGGQDRYYQIVRCLRDEATAPIAASSSRSSTSRWPSSTRRTSSRRSSHLRPDHRRDAGCRGAGALPTA
jgi:hypothetical protein